MPTLLLKFGKKCREETAILKIRLALFPLSQKLTNYIISLQLTILIMHWLPIYLIRTYYIFKNKTILVTNNGSLSQTEKETIQSEMREKSLASFIFLISLVRNAELSAQLGCLSAGYLRNGVSIRLWVRLVTKDMWLYRPTTEWCWMLREAIFETVRWFISGRVTLISTRSGRLLKNDVNGLNQNYWGIFVNWAIFENSL